MQIKITGIFSLLYNPELHLFSLSLRANFTWQILYAYCMLNAYFYVKLSKIALSVIRKNVSRDRYFYIER